MTTEELLAECRAALPHLEWSVEHGEALSLVGGAQVVVCPHRDFFAVAFCNQGHWFRGRTLRDAFRELRLSEWRAAEAYEAMAKHATGEANRLRSRLQLLEAR